MKNQYRFTTPPDSLHRTKLDNLALVPGNLLPQKELWQEVANNLPEGGALIVLPTDNPGQKRTLLAVAKLLAQEGHQVRVMSAEEFQHVRSDFVQGKLEV